MSKWQRKLQAKLIPRTVAPPKQPYWIKGVFRGTVFKTKNEQTTYLKKIEEWMENGK